MSYFRRKPRRVGALMALVVAVTTGPGSADAWLAYIGGGLQPIEDGWEERNGRVLFTMPSGTLASVAFQDVDLPTSTFITWQLGGRMRIPPRAPLADTSPETEADPKPPCVSARVLTIDTGETLQVETSEGPETIHLACLDTPEIQHQFTEIGWFGRATLSAVQLGVKPGAEVCLTELTPPKSDKAGHRIVYVILANGADYTAVVISDGLGLVRAKYCGRAAYYRRLEDRAIAEQRGLWGRASERAAFEAASPGPAISAGPPAARWSGGG